MTVAADGAFTYTPDTGFDGTDSFVYTITDENGLTDSAVVTITIEDTDPPVALDDSYTTSEDTALVEPASGVLINDSDPDGDSFTVSANGDPSNGTVTVAADGAFTYTPDTGFDGTDSFVYTITDENGLTDSAVVTITVDPLEPPVVQDKSVFLPDDTAEMTETFADGYALKIAAPTDPDTAPGDLTITVTELPTKGTVYLAGGISAVAVSQVLTLAELQGLVYKPDGVDDSNTANDPIDDEVVFRYSVDDGDNPPVIGTVNITTLLGRVEGGTSTIGGVDGSPLTFGNNQEADFPVTQALIDAVPDFGDGEITLRTDFQKSGFPNNPPPFIDDNNPLTTVLPSLEAEVTISIFVDGIEFIVVEAGAASGFWNLDPVDVIWESTASFSDIIRESDGVTTLADYLTANPPSAGDTWEIVYNDSGPR